MNKAFAVEWYDESETGEIVASGTTIFAGSVEYRKAQWDKLVEEHTACYLRHATTEELYAIKNRWER
jgi:hypothetical protein